MFRNQIDFDAARAIINSKVSMTIALESIFGGSIPRSGQKQGMFDCVSPKCDGTDTASIYIGGNNLERCKCFKCGMNEDLTHTVMQVLNVKYVDAIKKLCEIAGVPVPTSRVEISEAEAHELKRKSAVYDIYKKALEFYELRLREKDMGEALGYLAGRDFPEAAIKEFRIGACGFNDLKQVFLDYDTNPFLVESGLVVEDSTGQRRDALINRIIFPYIDHKGRCIGFTGRLFKQDEIDSDRYPKYKNLTNGPVFDKSKALFGLGQVTNFFQIRDKERPVGSAIEEKTALLLEGQPCVVKCHYYGFRIALAASGNAITEDHIRSLQKAGFRKVVTCYDQDSGGLKGLVTTIKSAAPFLSSHFKIAVMRNPGEKDPDEFFSLSKEERTVDREKSAKKRKELQQNFKKAFDKSQPLHEVLLDILMSNEIGSEQVVQFESVSDPLHVSSTIKEAKKVLSLFEDEEYMHAVSLILDKKIGAEPGFLSKGAKELRTTVALKDLYVHRDIVSQQSEVSENNTLRLGAALINHGYSKNAQEAFDSIVEINPNDEDVVFVRRLFELHRENGKISLQELIGNFEAERNRNKVKKCIDYVLGASAQEAEVWGHMSSIAQASQVEVASRRQEELSKKIADGGVLSPEEVAELSSLAEIKRQSRRSRGMLSSSDRQDSKMPGI